MNYKSIATPLSHVVWGFNLLKITLKNYLLSYIIFIQKNCGGVFVKYGPHGFIKYGATFSVLIVFALLSVMYVVPAFANTHTSIVNVTPHIVPNASSVMFIADVQWTGGPDPIHEFRVYQPLEFSDLNCYPATDWYNPQYGYTTINGTEYYYCQWNAKTGYRLNATNPTKDFNFSLNTARTESCRDLFIETRDDHGFYAFHNPQVCVDTSGPNTTKSFVGPNKTINGVEWIDGVTTVVLTAVDPEPHPSGVDKTWYRIDLDESESACWHEYRDGLVGLGAIQVDPCQPARIEYPRACAESAQDYCTEEMQLTKGTDDWYSCVEEYANTECQMTGWKLYNGTPIGGIEESCRVMSFFSVDNVGNVEAPKANCFFVDKTPPVIRKDVGSPNVPVKDGFDYWVNQSTPITMYCEDTGPHPSNDVTIFWNYTVDGSSLVSGSYKGESKTIYFPEDSVHRLEFWCKDAVQKESIHDIETFKVDSVPPTITKTVIGPQVGDCPPNDDEDTCYIKDTTGGDGTIIHVEAMDPDPTGHGCNVNQVVCEWGYYLDGVWQGMIGDDIAPPFNVTFPEDSNHTLKIKCWDALKNKVTDIETFKVDSIPPVTTKTYGTPTIVVDDFRWITSATPIYLNAVDAKVGVDDVFYRVTLMNVSDGSCVEACQYVGSGAWNEIEANHTTFTIPQQSCHLIEFYSNDRLNNTETTKRQCVFVDNTEPVASAGHPVGPHIECNATEGCNFWVRDHVTNVTLSCRNADGESHPAPLDKLQWRIGVDGVWGSWNEGNANSDVKFAFNEDSVHTVQYTCNDTVGNEDDIKTKTYRVDSTPPVINKTIIGPVVMKGNDTYVRDHVTNISVTAVDPDPTGKGCAVDKVVCRYGIQIDDGGWSYGSWASAPFQVTFNEDSTHILHVRCQDALNNTAETSWTFKVDSTPPETTKKYSKPCYPSDGDWCGHDAPEWISGTSNITLSASDPSVSGCKVGLDQIWYRVTLVNDQYCKNNTACMGAAGSGGWIDTIVPEETKTFTINEDSCHLIEYYSVDLLGNKEATKRQCVYVDNQGPLVNKTIADPKEKWAGDNTFYPNLTTRCWGTGQDAIECWKVTMGTPISILCNDPQPHPVDHNKMCFKLQLDGDNMTDKYCENYQGQMNEEGWCCVERGIENFQFLEESQHNLAVQCTDALGNKGPVDDEKFKVEGCPFEICLNKKWNLISVPFVLFNDDPNVVFQNASSSIDSVWTYDNGAWKVWKPGVGGTLDSIQPGWGYWVLAKENKCFEIAGSLLSPITTPPSRVLDKGWNLIGYYGNTKMSLDGETFDGLFRPNCDIPDKPVYCALNSLIDTQQGFPRWSALYNYFNNGGDNAGWVGLDACCRIGLFGSAWCPNGEDKGMEAGKGYWIEMDVVDGYSPSTNCIWNDDLKCVLQQHFS